MSYQFPTSHQTDETILESYLESLVTSSFPNEIRRVLEHMRYLNNETDGDLERLREMQDVCLDEVKRGVLEYRQDLVNAVNGGEAGKKRARDEASDIDMNKEAAEEDTNANNQQKKQPTPDARVPQIPSTEEILSHLFTSNPQIFEQQQQIEEQNVRLKQLSAERIQTAHQLRHMVDMALGRLNRDLEVFERELGIVHETAEPITNVAVSSLPLNSSVQQPALASAPSTSAPTLDRVALQSLDKSNNKNPKPNLRRASTNTSSSSSAPHPASLLRSNSAALPISSSAGTFTERPKDLAAIQVTPNSTEWILAKVLAYDKSSKMYTLSDEDIAEDKVYTISSSQVIPLNSKVSSSVYTRGDVVHAVYPDTTSFYLATVSSCKGDFVMVHFRDDGDEFGVTHEKAVPVWLVMKVPGKS